MFQNQVYITPAAAVPGDFASSNPMIYKATSNGRMVADTSGVAVGKFAVLNVGSTTAGTVTSIPGAAPASATQVGFVHREYNAAITTYLAESGNLIAPGQGVALFTKGDFWASADVVETGVVHGSPIYWDTLTGNTIIGAPSSPPATTVETGFYLVTDASQTISVGSTVKISTQA